MKEAETYIVCVLAEIETGCDSCSETCLRISSRKTPLYLPLSIFDLSGKIK
jgi:hypothetical protein